MATGMVDQIKDPILDKIIAGIEEKLDPNVKTGYQAIVVAGMHILFSGQTHHIIQRKFQEATKSGNVPLAIVAGTVRLMLLILHQSKGKANGAALIPAAITLMCHLFDFAEHSGKLKVTPDMIAGATKLVTQRLLKAIGINQQQLADGANYLKNNAGKQPDPNAQPQGAPPAPPDQSAGPGAPPAAAPAGAPPAPGGA